VGHTLTQQPKGCTSLVAGYLYDNAAHAVEAQKNAIKNSSIPKKNFSQALCAARGLCDLCSVKIM
jgi:hypothetical protein